MSSPQLESQQAVAALPATVDSLPDSRLRVMEPFAVTWEVVDGTYIAEAPEIEEWGEGDTPEKAIKDLQVSIAEGYFELDEYRGRLGRDLQRIYDTVTRKLAVIDANNGA